MTHTPGPWMACHDGKYRCKLVCGKEHPIAQIISGEWGDDYPNIRLVTSQHGIGRVAEAYMDRIVYGEVDEEIAQANTRLIVVAPELLTMLKETADELDAIMDQKGHTAQTRAIRDRAYALIAIAKGEQ